MFTIRIAGGVGVGVAFTVAVPGAAFAEDIAVTNLNDSGSGSLRNALDAANTDADADRIVFRSKLSGELRLADQLPVVEEPTTIVGPGARRVTVDGAGERVFLIPTDPGDDVAISGLTITGGHAIPLFGSGGGIAVQGADFTLSRATVRGNLADVRGGGIASFGGSLTIESSTISGNVTDGPGGGVYTSDSDVSIRGSTISGNEAGVEGGGAFLGGLSNPSIELRNSTVTRNEAQGGDGGGGLYESGAGAKTLLGTIVAGNSHGNTPDLDDGPWSAAFSLIGDTSGAGITDGGGNLPNADPKLKPLKNNGGPTDTHAFKKSPAKNKGPSDAPNSDQRGAPRKGKPDIGAYEFTKCEGVIVNRVGTAKKDKLKGTKKKDGILGLGGNDKLAGKKGKDGLCGGQGKDKLKGGPGKDKLDGGPGKDKEVQ